MYLLPDIASSLAMLQAKIACYQRHGSESNIYSVMQSEGNSLCWDVVLDSSNKAYRDDDNILEHIFEKQIWSDCYYENLIFSLHYKKMHINIRVALKSNFMSSVL